MKTRTADEIYEEISTTRTPVGPGADVTDAGWITYWEAVAAVWQRREELWMQLGEVVEKQRPRAPLWQYAAVRGAADGAFERRLQADEKAREARERMEGS